MTKTLRQSLVLLALPALTTFSLGVSAAEPTPAPVMETYTCNFNAGQGMKDLMAARDYYVKQADKAGIELGASYLLSLFKGSLPFDLVWMTPHASLAAFATATEAEAAATDLADVQARFNTVVDCTPNLSNLTMVFQREGYVADGKPGFVSAYACSARSGVGPAAVQDLTNHISDVLGSMGGKAPNAMFMMTPITQGPTSADMVFLVGSDSVSSWANFTSAIRENAGGPGLIRHFEAVSECDLALWDSQRVIAPPTE